MVFSGHIRFLRCLGLLSLVSVVFTPAALASATVSDTWVSQQWGWYRIKADKACDAGFGGAGVVVALIDTGVDVSHPDLSANIIGGWNFVDKNSNVTDVDGHGTMVCGIIGAIANNSLGVAGVAPNVGIMPLKVVSEAGGSWVDINSAIRYAADNGAKIISMSIGGNYSRMSQATEAAIDYAYRKGCILVAAAGNDNSSELFYPACYEQVIAVSAIDQDDKKASFSNYGDYIDFCAPGVSILTTCKGGEYVYGDGTSFAAPFVTGVIALMVSQYPYLATEEVIETLRAEAEDLGESGWDQFYGWGLIDAYATVSQTPIPELTNVIPFILTISTTTTILILRKQRRRAGWDLNPRPPP